MAPGSDQPDQPISQVEDPGPGPDELAQTEQDRLMVEAAMARLPPQQRLLLRLRFEQNLTLAEIARLTRLPDPFRANRQIQAALVALEETPEIGRPQAAKLVLCPCNTLGCGICPRSGI